MDNRSGTVWQYPCGVHSRFAALGISKIMGQRLGSDTVEPMEFPGNAYALSVRRGCVPFGNAERRAFYAQSVTRRRLVAVVAVLVETLPQGALTRAESSTSCSWKVEIRANPASVHWS